MSRLGRKIMVAGLTSMLIVSMLPTAVFAGSPSSSSRTPFWMIADDYAKKTKAANPGSDEDTGSSAGEAESQDKFSASVAEMIRKAAPGATVTVNSFTWPSLGKGVVDALNERQDVSLSVNHNVTDLAETPDGDLVPFSGRVNTVIPAGADLSGMITEVGGLYLEAAHDKFNPSTLPYKWSFKKTGL